MFIDRVTNPKAADTWYHTGRSPLNPSTVISGQVETHTFKVVEDHFKSLYPRNASIPKSYMSDMMARYNPLYTEVDSQLVKGISVILAFKNYGLEVELNNLLFELEF